MSYRLVNANVIEGLRQLPDASVHCVVTSPPYWSLRDYNTPPQVFGGDPECDHEWGPEIRAPWANEMSGPNGRRKNVEATRDRPKETGPFCQKCDAWRGSLGLEPTPELFLRNMRLVFREVWRVLRDDGTLWVNMGDSYVGSWGNYAPTGKGGQREKLTDRWERPAYDDKGAWRPATSLKHPVLKSKDLVGMPWRLALALQAEGWWLRSDIIWCLSGGTWVYARTQKGDRPIMIRDLARLRPETVQLWNGQKWTRLLGISRTSRNADEIELVLRSGERISCTPTHQFPTSRGLLAASDIKIGDKLIRVQLPEPDQPLSPLHITEDAAWFVGLYIAEGSRSEDTIQIAGHIKETERWERVQKIAADYGGSATKTLCGNKMNIRVYGKMLNAIIDHLVTGKNAKTKAIAPVFWRYSNRHLEALLDGYLSGDGYKDTNNNRWRIGFTRNYNLERDLRTLCARLGFRLTLNFNVASFDGRRFPAFRGEIRKERSGHHNEKDLAEVVEIHKARCREVYDLGVEDDPHLFALASGILTHNSKPNPMPESVTDRPTKAHEYIFLLAKSERYFYDHEAIKEPAAQPERVRADQFGGKKYTKGVKHTDGSVFTGNETRNKRSVWALSTKANPEAHFATFPLELPRICIKAGTSERGCCAKCGAPWVRVIERRETGGRQVAPAGWDDGADSPGSFHKNGRQKGKTNVAVLSSKTVGWAPSCDCPDAGEPVPCTVLDMFAGTSTTGAAAIKLGRLPILIELNPDYCEISERRLREAERQAYGELFLPIVKEEHRQAGLFGE